MNMCDASVYRSYDGLVCLSVGWYIWDLPGKMYVIVAPFVLFLNMFNSKLKVLQIIDSPFEGDC